MASPQSSQRYLSKQDIQQKVATGTAGTILAFGSSWIDVNDWHGLVAAAVLAVKSGNGMTKLEIVANDASDGSGTTVVVKDSGTIAADAVGDEAFLECSAEEVKEVGVRDYTADPVVDRASDLNLRYVNVRVTNHATGDVVGVTVVGDPMHHKLNKTPATRIA